MTKKRLDSLIDVAIEREEEALTFYRELMGKVADKGVKDTLEFLAAEEKKHKEFLENYKKGAFGAEGLSMTSAVDYKIAEHLEKPDPAHMKEDKDAYLIAANRELQSYNFYTALANIHPDGAAKEMLLKMANQEMKHKEKVEYLYTNAAFPQTAGG